MPAPQLLDLPCLIKRVSSHATDAFAGVWRGESRRGIFRVLMAMVLWLLASGLACQAEPIGPERATQAAKRWLELSPAPMARQAGTPGEARAYANAQGVAQFYVVELVPAGYVVVAADDEVEPILAFSHEDRFLAQAGNPLFEFLGGDVAGRLRGAQRRAVAGKMSAAQTRAADARRAKWALLTTQGGAEVLPRAGRLSSRGGISDLDDMRVEPFVKSRWDQSVIWVGQTQVPVFNYYTPPYSPGNLNNYVAGCVATAWAQLMRYHEWPKTGVGTGTYSISVDGTAQMRALRGGNGAGGPYNWASMVYVPDGSTTVTQRQAIGALLHDVGVANNMAYSVQGSNAYVNLVPLRGVFGYASGAIMQGDLDQVLLAMRTNLDARLPVVISIRTSSDIGHLVICDGYGFNVGTAYHHLNMGWSGACDAWYHLPDTDTDYLYFDRITSCVYNIDPRVSGEIVCGRITNQSGAPMSGVTVTVSGPSVHTATTDAKGIFAVKGLKLNTAWRVTHNAGSLAFGPSEALVTTGSSTDYSQVGNRIVDAFEATDRVPEITENPVNRCVIDGQPANFRVGVVGISRPVYLWQVSQDAGATWSTVTDDAVYRGASTGSLEIPAARTSMSGYRYRCTVGDGGSLSLLSTVAELTFGWSQLSALSARAQAGSGDATLTLGFVFRGSGTKPALVRGVGPGIAAWVSNYLADPQLRLMAFDSGAGAWTEEAINDNWGGSAELSAAFTETGAGSLESVSLDSALLGSLRNDIYTALVSGKGGATGVALAEVYDADMSLASRRLVALSVRNQVGTKDNILIAGFVLDGRASRRVIVRGVGPGIASGVPSYLVNPRVQVWRYFPSTQTWQMIGENDDWGGSAELSALFSQAGMGALSPTSTDAALVLDLEPGIYTAQLSGVGETTGVGVVEIYEAP